MINTQRFGTELNPSGFPNGEFNMDLITHFVRPNFSYGKTELNPNIIRNSDTSLAGLVQLNSS